MRLAALLLVCAIFTPLLAAQDKADEKPIDLAVAYPSTAMVYFRADTNDYFKSLNPEEIFAGLQDQMHVPDLGEIARDRLQLNLTEAEVEALAKGVQGMSGALLDVGLSGPKFEMVFHHEDLGPLARALKDARDKEALSVPDVQDYYGSKIYEIQVPMAATTSGNGGMGMGLNPMSDWLSTNSIWVNIYKNRYLIVANSVNAVKDAVDYISFPDDPVDTLLGNSRYKEAIADFDKPQAVFFVNVQSVINSVERLAGDKGSASPMQEMLQAIIGVHDEQVQFFFNLVQYEQFKSFAAGFWLDEKALTLRMDANLVFHNAPGWFDAVRIKPKAMPLTSFIPADAMLALTDCVDQPADLYRKARDFFIERAKAAGQTALVEGWQNLQKQMSDGDTNLEGALGQLGGGQGIVIMPGDNKEFAREPVGVAGLLAVKDRKQAENYFFEKLLPSGMGRAFKGAEGEITPVSVVNGVEIHASQDGNWGFAFMGSEGDAGVFLVGSLDALKAIVKAHADGGNLHSKDSWNAARNLLWKEGSLHLYINVGSMLLTMSKAFVYSRNWNFDNSENAVPFDRDDTERDDDPIPFLADMFGNTVVVGSTRSAERSVSIRIAAAGWPDRRQMRGMALHYRDVQRNKMVRDDFVRVREAARNHLVLKGAPAADVQELIDAGYLAREEWTVDPYGADEDEDKTRTYAMAEVPKDVDIRQAIVCAYQRKPGLRGDYLAVLWNSHIVELTPDGLKKALELAKQGKPLPADGGWYKAAENPLYLESDPRKPRFEEWVQPTNTVQVTVIDDDGNETTDEVDEDELLDTTESMIDNQEADSKDQ